MNSRAILGITIAAVFAMTTVTAMAQPTWLGFEPGTSASSSNNKITTLTLTANATVPHRTTDLAGFAWIYNPTSNGFNATAITIHRAFDLFDSDPYNEIRDSTQNPDNWHLHNVKLTQPTVPGNAVLCVADLQDAPTGGISFSQDQVKVKIKSSKLQGTFPSTPTAVAFEIVVANNCPPTIGTEGYGNANNPVGPAPLGLIPTQAGI